MLVTEAVLKSSKMTAKNYVGGGKEKGKGVRYFYGVFLALKKEQNKTSVF